MSSDGAGKQGSLFSASEEPTLPHPQTEPGMSPDKFSLLDMTSGEPSTKGIEWRILS